LLRLIGTSSNSTSKPVDVTLPFSSVVVSNRS
jgi:hypothetical protein